MKKKLVSLFLEQTTSNHLKFSDNFVEVENQWVNESRAKDQLWGSVRLHSGDYNSARLVFSLQEQRAQAKSSGAFLAGTHSIPSCEQECACAHVRAFTFTFVNSSRRWYLTLQETDCPVAPSLAQLLTSAGGFLSLLVSLRQLLVFWESH